MHSLFDGDHIVGSNTPVVSGNQHGPLGQRHKDGIVDFELYRNLNGAITSLGKVGAEEKAAVMLEFAHFFYADEPLASAGVPLVDTDVQTPPKTSSPGKNKRPRQTPGQVDLSGKTAKKISDEEQAILHTQDKLRHKVDPGKIDWGKAGYDFGEGFKGPEEPR